MYRCTHPHKYVYPWYEMRQIFFQICLTCVCVSVLDSTITQCFAVCCSVLQCVAVCCSVLQYVAVTYEAYHSNQIHLRVVRCLTCFIVQCVAVYYSVLQCIAVCCSVLQCIAVCCNVLQCVAVCCSVLQCITVCCSVLQSHMRQTIQIQIQITRVYICLS